MAKLTVKLVSSLKEPGMFSDGGGLYVRVGPTGGKSWILRTVVHGRRRELGLGSVSLVTLAEARNLAHEYRKIARKGGDPDTVRKQESLTFSDAAQRVHKALLPTWRNDKHAATWLSSLERLCCTNELRDSSCESSMIARAHEQLGPYEVQDHELVDLQ